jgi:serine/alanine adding enzyme
MNQRKASDPSALGLAPTHAVAAPGTWPVAGTPVVRQARHALPPDCVAHHPVPVLRNASTQAMTVRPFTPEDAPTWDDFVLNHPQASVYHLSGWRAVCADAFGHECPYLVACEGQQITGVLPLVTLKSRLFGHFMVSLPYFNYGGVLARDDPTRQALLAAASQRAAQAGCSHIELRDTQAMPGWPVRRDKVSMWLELPASTDELWQRLGSKLRAQVKKAQSAGPTFSIGGIEMLDAFYRVFATHMRDLGTPVYGKNFFRTVLEQAPGHPEIVIGKTADGETVSAALLLRFNHRMEVPWAATLRKAHATNINMALYWHMLQHACEQRCGVFDFGRSTRDAPTYRFKKQWGAQPKELHWHYWLPDNTPLPGLNPQNPKYQLAIGVWKRLPVWLTKVIGPFIVKNLP